MATIFARSCRVVAVGMSRSTRAASASMNNGRAKSRPPSEFYRRHRPLLGDRNAERAAR